MGEQSPIGNVPPWVWVLLLLGGGGGLGTLTGMGMGGDPGEELAELEDALEAMQKDLEERLSKLELKCEWIGYGQD